MSKVEGHFAGSVQFDTDDGQTADSMVYGLTEKHLIENLIDLLKRRKNSEVLFAAWVDRNQKEYDITKHVRELCYKKL